MEHDGSPPPSETSSTDHAVAPTARVGERSRVAIEERPPGNASRVVRTLARETWAAFVKGHPDTSIFHTPQMYDVFASAKGHMPEVWASTDAAGQVQALFTPVAITVLGWPLRALTTRSVAFAGPLLRPGAAGPESLDALLHAYRRGGSRSSSFTEIRNVTDGSALSDILAANGFRHEAHLNFLVDLEAAEEEIRARIASSARRNIRKAIRAGITVEATDDASALDEGYRVLREVYRRIRVPLPDASLFQAAHRVLRPLGGFEMLVARTAGRPVGVMTLLFNGGVVTYWYTGTLRDQAALPAGDLLVWSAIETGRARGCRVLDFGGAGRPDEPYGVRAFKAKYGGTLVDHGRDTWERSQLRTRFATGGYTLARRFMGGLFGSGREHPPGGIDR